ncbi:PEP-CTERM sorting domain-containing protein [Pontiella desulfatans]|nr:PEP-CTERM sorting domain-containing protein [Pontiella desulfatans]
MRKGEALLYTVSIDSALQSYLSSNGYSLRLTEFTAGIVDNASIPLSLFTQAGGATAVASATDTTAVSVNTVLTDGMQFAFVHGGSGSSDDVSLASIAVDVIPEPATLGMIAASGLGILFVRRRIML